MCEKCFVSQSITHLKTRLSNHISDHRKYQNQKLLDELGKADYNVDFTTTELERLAEKTILIQHSIHTGHLFDNKNISVLGKDNNKQKLNMLEMIFISQRSSVNAKSDIGDLSSLYTGLLDKI